MADLFLMSSNTAKERINFNQGDLKKLWKKQELIIQQNTRKKPAEADKCFNREKEANIEEQQKKKKRDELLLYEFKIFEQWFH